MTGKEQVQAVIDSQPDDATFDELVRELKFQRMIDRGLDDVREGRVISHEEVGRRIKKWQK